MKLLKTLSLAAAAVTLSLAGCNSNDEPSTGEATIFGDFVTLVEADSQGAIMKLIPTGMDKTVTLSTAYKFDLEKFKADTRIFINYITPDDDNTVDGPVNIVNALNVDGAGKAPEKITAEKADDWKSQVVTVSYLNLTGNYVNFIYSGKSVGTPTSRNFYLDSETLDSAYPELHIVFEGNLSEGEQKPYAVRGSYSLAELVGNKKYKGVKVLYPENSNSLTSTTLEFDRLTLNPMP